MKKVSKKALRMRSVLPLAAVILFVCLAVFTTLWQDETVPALSGWHDSSGNAVSLMDQPAMKQGETRIIYVKLPSNAGGHMIAVRTENVTIQAWAGNLLLYKTPETVVGVCPGDQLVLLTLPSQSGGALLRIEATAPLSYGSLPIRHVYYGESLTILHLLMRNSIPSLLLNGALLLSGFLLSLSFLFRGGRRCPNTWLGLAITALSCWTLTQAYIVLAAGLPRFWFLIGSYASFPLAACFLFAYLADSSAGPRHLLIFYIVGAVTCGVWSVLCIVWNATGFAPYPTTKPISLVLLAACAGAMLWSLSTPLREKQRISLHLPGFLLLLCGEVMDAILFHVQSTLDYALYTRLGLMVFIVCVTWETARSLSRSIRQAARADALQRAAYLDALTGLYNRRAYERDFAALCHSKTASAIVMMDIDDLKYANDVYGHKQGDELIRAAARVILGAFEGCGDCYRYGGDEFVVLVRQNVNNCNAALRRVDRLSISDNHVNAALHPPLHISVGFALCCPEQGGTPIQAQRLADERMYANKKERKAQRASS